MEVDDSSEVPKLKAGKRSRSNSEDLMVKPNEETSDETSKDKPAEDTNDEVLDDRDLPNGAEHASSPKEDEVEDEEMEGEEEGKSPVKEPCDTDVEGSKDVSSEMDVDGEQNLERDKDIDNSKNDVGDAAEKRVEEENEVSGEKEGDGDKEGNGDKEGDGDKSVEKELCFEDTMESGGSSEKWQLNIDTSGSSATSDQGVSDTEEPMTEETKEIKEKCLSEQGDVSSDELEDFIGFDPSSCTNDDSCIMEKLIETYEINGVPTDDDDDCDDDSDEDDNSKTGVISSSQKLALFLDRKSDGLEEDDESYEFLNQQSIKEERENSSERSDVHSSTDTPSGKVDGAHLLDMMGSEEVTSSTTNSPSWLAGRGKKLHVDVTNPAFRKPLEMGWKRELVYRNTSEPGNKRMADIYYYTPLGKKVRSNREVVENLVGNELSIDNFTFFKEPLGINDPQKEIIRDAKRVSMKVNPEASGTPPKKIKVVTQPVKEKSLHNPFVRLIKDPAISSSAVKEKISTPKTKSKTFPRIKVTPLRNQLPAVNLKPALISKPKKDTDNGELEMGMLPPMWKDPSTAPISKKAALTSSGSSQLTLISPGSKAAMSSSASKSSTTNTTTWSSILKQSEGEEPHKHECEHRQFMQFFMMNLGAGYAALGQVFQYLKVQELLRAARVCRMWHDLAGQPSLWRTVRMKNSQIVDWKGCADALRRYGTRHLDLRKMLLQVSPSVMWEEFCSVVGSIQSLRQLDLCRCSASVIERISEDCPQLLALTALSVKCTSIRLQFVNNMKNLQELRLKSLNGIHLLGKLDVLQNLTQLKHLSLTTFKELGRSTPNVIGSLSSLESLELGEFCDFPENFGSALSKLTKLQRLRLEKGQGKLCPTFSVLGGVKSLPHLSQLELVNFDVKPGFDQALAQCTNLRRLLIIPTYVTQSATTNHMVLGGVTKLSGSLVHFVWGVTHELLRVTELFVDQCEGQKGARPTGKGNKKNGTGDSIPVLRPVPGFVEDPLVESDKTAAKNPGKEETSSEDMKPSAASQQVDILPISKLTTLLVTALPNTTVKILKIPFHATWRQSIGEHSH